MTPFDPEFAAPADWARLYREHNVQVVPAFMPGEPPKGLSWKRPLLKTWVEYQEALVPLEVFNPWYGNGGQHVARPNMGMITGTASDNCFVIDLDHHKNASAAAWWDTLMMVHNNCMDLETVEQTTGGGGSQKIYRAPPGWVAPTMKTSIGVDIRGQGGFAMLPPSLHESGHHYEWLDGHGPDEIEVALAPDWLLEAVEKLVLEHGGALGANGKSHQPPPEGVYDALSGHRIDGREDHMFRHIWAAMTGLRIECPAPPSSKEANQVWEEYLRNNAPKTRLPGEDVADGLEREGRGRSLFDQKWAYARKKWDTEIEQAAKERAAREKAERPKASEPPPEAPAATPPAVIKLRSAFPIDRMAIPTRDWAVPGLLLKRNLTVLVAPPGSGKSLLTLQMGIMEGVGRPWAGWMPRRAEKVLIINAEDDQDELDRRLFIAAEEMGIDHTVLVGQVLMPESLDSIVIARADNRTKTVVRTPLIEALVQTIIAEGIGVVIVDPFAETFEGDENSNSEVKWAAILWREVARRTGCALMLVHHTRKYAGDMAGNADASRGAGALIGTARILSTLFAMTEDEAAALNIPVEERHSYVRFDDAKANHSRMGVAKWFIKKSVDLGNGTALAPSDEVGVMVPWKPPGALDGVSVHSIGLALDVIERGVLDDDGRPTGQRFSAKVTSNNRSRWAGTFLMQSLSISEEVAKNLIRDWLKEGVLETFDYDDPIQRKSRVGVRVNASKRPDRAPQPF